jgi:biopolymer transport protein ExbB/TolQ
MNQSLLLLVATAVVLILILVSGAALLVRYKRRLDAINAELNNLKRSLSIFDDGAQGIGRRLVEAERQLKSVVSDQVQFKQQSSNQSYTDAASLVAQGLSVDQVVERSDLSRAEVELMVLLRESDHQPESIS